MLDLGLAYACSTGVFGMAAFLTVTADQNPVVPDWLQYGAFGLCVVMVMYLLYYVKTMGDIIRKKDDQYIELLRQDIESRNRLAECLKDRQCVAGDHRIKE